MQLMSLFENGAKLLFQYFKVVDGKRTSQLLASCEHTCILAAYTATGEVVPRPLPSKLVKALLK
jgi:hypothetical protein